MNEIPIYTRLRDMPRELADKVRGDVQARGGNAPPGKPSYDTITGRVNASFTCADYEVALSRDTVRDILRRSRPRTKEDKSHEPRKLTAEEEGAETHKEQENFALREERALLKKKLKKATQEQTALAAMQKGIEIVTRDASLLLPTFEPANIIIRDPEDHIEEAVLFCSCWHYGEVVSERETTGFGKYDIPTCQASIQVMTDAVLGLILDHHRGLNIRKLWVVEVGDSVSGIIHDELVVTNERPIATQVVGSALLRALSLRDLAAHIDEVEHIGIVGNHGRTTRRPAHKEKAEDSFDRMSYEYTSLLTSKIPNIKSTIAPSPKHLATINGHRFLFEHGDSIRMWMGFPYYGAAREQAKLLSSFVNAKNLLANNQQLAEYMSQGFRYFCFGNFHTSMVADGPNGSELIATGSPKGVDEYSWDFLSTGSLPSQQFFGVHHRRGVSFRYKLDLSDRDPEKHTRYLFDLTDVSLRDAAGELGLL